MMGNRGWCSVSIIMIVLCGKSSVTKHFEYLKIGPYPRVRRHSYALILMYASIHCVVGGEAFLPSQKKSDS